VGDGAWLSGGYVYGLVRLNTCSILTKVSTFYAKKWGKK